MRVVTDDLIPVLETAALRYAGMSLDEFDGDGCLRVSSSRMYGRAFRPMTVSWFGVHQMAPWWRECYFRASL